METQPKRSKLSLVFAGVIGILFLVLIFTYQLRVSELAVVTTLGKPAVVTRPGLHWRLPWPAQKVVRFDKRRQLYEGISKETSTRDNVNLIVKLFATWSVAEPLQFFSSVGSLYEAETILKSVIESHQETLIRTRSFAEFLASANGASGLAEIESELRERIDQQTKKTYGIAIHFVGISQLGLPENNTTSVLERMKQEQAEVASRIRAEGEKEAKIMKDNASSLKAQKLARAEADAKRIRGDALIKAAEQYEKFNEDLEFAMFLRKLDALEETMKTKTTIILDPTTPPYDLLKDNDKSQRGAEATK